MQVCWLYYWWQAISVPVRGQQLYGSINGVVTDPNGGLVPNATVTATNEDTNAATSVKTDSAGAYIITNLQPGVYDVETSVESFAPYKQTAVHVEVGLATTVDVRLQLAGQQATVTVTSEAPVVNTEQSVFGTDINQTAMADLPVNTQKMVKFRDPDARGGARRHVRRPVISRNGLLVR